MVRCLADSRRAGRPRQLAEIASLGVRAKGGAAYRQDAQAVRLAYGDVVGPTELDGLGVGDVVGPTELDGLGVLGVLGVDGAVDLDGRDVLDRVAALGAVDPPDPLRPAAGTEAPLGHVPGLGVYAQTGHAVELRLELGADGRGTEEVAD